MENNMVKLPTAQDFRGERRVKAEIGRLMTAQKLRRLVLGVGELIRVAAHKGVMGTDILCTAEQALLLEQVFEGLGYRVRRKKQAVPLSPLIKICIEWGTPGRNSMRGESR
jgi:hypothetical protein